MTFLVLKWGSSYSVISSHHFSTLWEQGIPWAKFTRGMSPCLEWSDTHMHNKLYSRKYTADQTKNLQQIRIELFVCWVCSASDIFPLINETLRRRSLSESICRNILPTNCPHNKMLLRLIAVQRTTDGKKWVWFPVSLLLFFVLLQLLMLLVIYNSICNML